MQDPGQRSGPNEEVVFCSGSLSTQSVNITRFANFGAGGFRYIQKFYAMRTQLQAISLRIQTVRSNEQMMASMKGATSLLGSMNRQMNLPALQRIAMEFEKENDIMDQRQEMMDDAIDDVTGLEDEEEGEEVVKEVLDEIGVDLGQAVRFLLDPSLSRTLESLAYRLRI